MAEHRSSSRRDGRSEARTQPDVDRYVESFREYEQAGYTHVYVHQVGRDQEGFFRFFEEELKPKL